MIDGIINIYKEKGFTSHDVVAKLRGILKQKKIGHTGTLDPDAQGVLPVCLGKGTRLCDMLTDRDKTYRTVMRLGVITDTQDSSGQILSERQVTVSEQQVRETVAGFIGEQMQIPPMYSALKVNGRKLYELAREGQTVERKARKVHFYKLTVLDVSLPLVTMEVTCSKGTYIRTLCHDIGGELGCGGCMQELLRTRVGEFTLENSVRLEEVESLVQEGREEELVTPVERMFEKFPGLVCSPDWDKLLHNGNPLPIESVSGQPVEGWIRFYDSQKRFVGIFEEKKNTGKYFPVKMFL